MPLDLGERLRYNSKLWYLIIILNSNKSSYNYNTLIFDVTQREIQCAIRPSVLPEKLKFKGEKGKNYWKIVTGMWGRPMDQENRIRWHVMVSELITRTFCGSSRKLILPSNWTECKLPSGPASLVLCQDWMDFHFASLAAFLLLLCTPTLPRAVMGSIQCKSSHPNSEVKLKVMARPPPTHKLMNIPLRLCSSILNFPLSLSLSLSEGFSIG